MAKQWLKVAEYTKRKGVSEQTVREKIKRGTVQWRKIEGITHVLYDDAEDLTQTAEGNFPVTAEETALNNALLDKSLSAHAVFFVLRRLPAGVF